MAVPAFDEFAKVIAHLHQQMGVRLPGSALEATAAAYVNARLRQYGARVGTQAFTFLSAPERPYQLIWLLALLAALLILWLPLLALLLAFWACSAVVLLPRMAQAPLSGVIMHSQTIFGTRAIVQDHQGMVQRQPQWRVLLVSALDTPMNTAVLRSILLAPRARSMVLRLSGPLCVVFAALLALLALPGALLLVGVAVLVLLSKIGGSAYAPAQAPPTAAHAASITTVIAALDCLPHLQTVELWGVLVGATSATPEGIHNFMRSFPFDPATTIVIGIEPLHGTQLAYASRTGMLAQAPADPLLLRLAAAADANDTSIDAEPRPFRARSTLTTSFQQRGYRTLTLFSVLAPATDPTRIADQATHLLCGMIEQLDQQTKANLS